MAKKKTQSQMLTDIALANAEEYWMSHDHAPYATIDKGHLENVKVTSSEYRQWLVKLYWEAKGDAPSDRAVRNTIEYLASRAMDGPQYRVSMRYARHQDNIYIDLGDKNWNCIEVSPKDWRLITNPPVKFRRTKNTGAMPLPLRGGSIDGLRPLMATTAENWVKIIGILLDAMKGHGPYLVTNVNGEQGSAKTTACKLLRMVLDPLNSGLLSSLPNERDLAVNGQAEYVLAFDNISHLSQPISDCLCRISTGAGFKSRLLYTSDELHVCDLCSPIILNGIPDFADSNDLLNRCIFIHQPPIETRLEETAIWQQFDAIKAAVLGGLLDMLSQGLRNLATTTLSATPRMADSTKWITACTGNEDFLTQQQGTEEEAMEMGLDASPTAHLVKMLLGDVRRGLFGDWCGTMTELLTELRGYATTRDGYTHSRSFPGSAKAMGNQMRRDAPFLRACGIAYEPPVKINGKRIARLAAQVHLNRFSVVGDQENAL